MIDLTEITRMIERFERLCQDLREVRQLIEHDLSPEHLRQAVQLVADLMIQDSEIQDIQIDDFHDRLKRIEDNLGLAPLPPTSGLGGRPRLRLLRRE